MINKYIRWAIGGFLLLLLPLLAACQNNPDTSSPKQEISFLALGDSYTIGESVPKDQRWSVQLTDSLQNSDIPMDDPKIIAKTGWTTAELQKAIDKNQIHSNYDLVSLLIGVNNQYQGLEFSRFKQEFDELLQKAITFADGNTDHVFVVSIPNYGVTPFGQEKNPKQIREELKRYNKTAQSIADQYEVTFINITPISEQASDNPDLLADDKLHPSGEMYQLWIDKILPEIIPKLP